MEVNTMNVKISKDMELQLEYAAWDIMELKHELPKLFPNAKSIEVTDCENDWLEVLVDEKYYTVNVTGYVKDGKIYEDRM